MGLGRGEGGAWPPHGNNPFLSRNGKILPEGFWDSLFSDLLPAPPPEDGLSGVEGTIFPQAFQPTCQKPRSGSTGARLHSDRPKRRAKGRTVAGGVGAVGALTPRVRSLLAARNTESVANRTKHPGGRVTAKVHNLRPGTFPERANDIAHRHKANRADEHEDRPAREEAQRSDSTVRRNLDQRSLLKR